MIMSEDKYINLNGKSFHEIDQMLTGSLIKIGYHANICSYPLKPHSRDFFKCDWREALEVTKEQVPLITQVLEQLNIQYLLPNKGTRKKLQLIVFEDKKDFYKLMENFHLIPVIEIVTFD